MRAATKRDWNDLRPMVRNPERVALDLAFDARQMHNLRRGFVPVDQNQKWFMYFEDGALHIHRSWTGFKMFEVVFEPQGVGAMARFALVNCDQEFYSGTLDEARETLQDVLQYYATDEAHIRYESNFGSALNEAATPNYLGRPAVVFELLGDLFQLGVNKRLATYVPDVPTATYQDILAANQHVCAVLCGEFPGYHGLEDWRTEKGLGMAVIAAFGLDENWYTDENLNCILTEGLAVVTRQVDEIVRVWLQDDAPATNNLVTVLGDLQAFVASVLMGTHSVLYPNAKLSDFTFAGAGQTDKENPQPASEARLGGHLSELLRELRKFEATEDRDPEVQQQEGEIVQPNFHPCLNDKGQPVPIHTPHKASAKDTWTNPAMVATFVPGGPVPAALNGVPFAPWLDHPTTAADWNAYEGLRSDLHEAAMKTLPGKKAAAGVVVIEPDGRVWLVHPTNGFGAYLATWPKGRIEGGLSLQGTAVREAMEESGLKVRITGLLGDFDRTTTRTRYYVAERIGGTPSRAGWESQACTLAPIEALPELLNGAADAPVLAALMALLASGDK